MRNTKPTSRRNFLGSIATGAAAISLATISPLSAGAKSFSENFESDNDPEDLFLNLKGKHKMVFDVTRPHEILPFAWPRVYLMTNELTGSKEKDSNAVVVLRHDAIPYAMNNDLWAKYKFGEMFKADDPLTKAAAVRNPFWMPKPGDYVIPAVGNVAIGINELQQSGVVFMACNVALSVYSAAVAQKMKQDPETIKKEWMSGLLPGINVVPSGVWAIGRAQEYGCAYCFAG
jgi:intracellular sulfur oxidation DsrE/DsrF family protein